MNAGAAKHASTAANCRIAFRATRSPLPPATSAPVHRTQPSTNAARSMR